jgi:acyl-CoA synthetase (AMP-forming)/AMP-acid ligase II
MLIRSLLEIGEPNHAALILADRAITYQQLDEQVDHAAEQLTNLGFRKGDRIGLAFPNGLEMIVTFLAASTVGTAAPLNPAYTRDEFKFYLEDTAARGLIVPRNGADEARAAANEIGVAVIDCVIDENGRLQLSSQEALEGTSADEAKGPRGHRTDPSYEWHNQSTQTRSAGAPKPDHIRS